MPVPRWRVYMTDARSRGYLPSEIDLHLDLDGTLLDQKNAALMAMASQTWGLIDGMTMAVFSEMNSTESFVQA